MNKKSSTNITRKRRMSGIVVRISGKNTVAVEVARVVQDPVYGKRLKKTTRYLAHDVEGTAKAGDKVTIEESRPISRRKRWIIIAQGGHV